MNTFASLFCDPLAHADAARLAAWCRQRRVHTVGRNLRRIAERRAAARLGTNLEQVLTELRRVLDERPQDFEALAAHWATAYLLGKLAEPDIPTGKAGFLVRVLRQLVLDNDDTPYVLGYVTAWRTPVVDGATIQALDPAAVDALPGSHLPMPDSLQRASDLLEQVWPPVNQWVRCVVPAFVDVGAPPTGLRLSASVGAAQPVFLGRVVDGWAHAEDVVHELQHCRLTLIPPDEAFESWGDLSERFASPYRDDPRPVRGVLMGLHAFVAVNRLRLRGLATGVVRLEHLSESLANEHAKNLCAFGSIARHLHARDAGRRLLAAIAGELAQQHGQITALVPHDVGAAAIARVKTHASRVDQQGRRGLLNGSSDFLNWNDSALADFLHVEEQAHAH